MKECQAQCEASMQKEHLVSTNGVMAGMGVHLVPVTLASVVPLRGDRVGMNQVSHRVRSL